MNSVAVTAATERVTALFVDKQDRIWVGTADAGLVIVDQAQHSFKRLRHDSRDAATLGDDSVHAIIEDQRGGMWVGTSKGLDRVDEATGKVERRMPSANAEGSGSVGRKTGQRPARGLTGVLVGRHEQRPGAGWIRALRIRPSTTTQTTKRGTTRACRRRL